MYTELNCAFSLKRDTPDEIVDTLLFMTGQDDEAPKSLSSHPLFSANRWQHMFRSSATNSDADAYGIAGVELSESSGRYRVTIRCNLINLDREIAQFIDWITPHIFARPGDFVGYTRSEEIEPLTLLLYPNRTVTRQIPDEIDGEPV
jgi:hypothetical protein